MNNTDILEEKEKEAIKDLEEYLHWEKLQGFSMLPRDKHIETLLNLVSNTIAENKEKDEEIENQDKTIDRLVKEQEEREKYTHQLEAENKELKEEKEKLGKLYYEANENCIKYEKLIENSECDMSTNYIRKSKVVEELKKAISEEIDTSKAMFEGDFINGYIYALQSLLGKE